MPVTDPAAESDPAALLLRAEAHARGGRVDAALAAAREVLAGLDEAAVPDPGHLARSHAHEAAGDLRAALDSLRRHLDWREAASAARLDLRARALALQVALDRRAAGRAAADAPARLADRAQLEAAADRLAAQQPDAPQLLLVVGLDHLARVNDAWSRITGDAVLHACEGVLRAQSRPLDLLARLGGDHFAFLPAGAVSTTRALMVAERLRAAIQAHAWGALQPGLAMSASVGVAARAPGEGLADALARAESALASCKRNGRNQVRNAN